jgi:pimeloyl-ACP methyl ester carboxylesterase
MKNALILMLAASSPAMALQQADSRIESVADGAFPAGTVSLATGVRLHFVEQGSLTGPAVILLHGYTDSWRSYARVLPLLADRFRVYALDQRGHGRSEQPDSGYGMEDLARDVIAFMDAKGITRAAIVGHSMGGLVAQQVVRLAPERVSRLVLVGSGSGIGHLTHLADFRAAVLGLTDPIPPEFAREFQYSTVHRPVPDDFMRQAVEESLRLPARLWQALMEGMFAMPRATGVSDGGRPTLVMWGAHDAVIPRSEVDALAALYPGAAVIVYPDLGHAPHWEDPGAFVRDLEAFLGR